MAKLGKAQITLAKSDPKPMYFQWSKSETVFAPKDTAFWITGSSFIFYGGGMIGTIPYQADWITDWTKVAAAKTDVYKYLWCKLNEDSEPFLFTGYSGLSMTTTREYTLQDNGALTEEQQQALPASAWVEEELLTWSWGKYIYKRLKRTTVETGTIVYTYSGRDTAAEDNFKKRLVFALSADRAVYTIDKRALTGATETITLRLNERYYNPDSLVWTLNGESFTPTQSESDSTVYSYEIAPLTAPSSQVIVVTPYRDGEAITGVSASVTLIGQDETDYYTFAGLVSTLPGTAGYIKGDSCFLSTDNLIYTFDGSAWVKLNETAALTDEQKIDVLTKAEKTAFEYAKDNGLSKDYAYFDVVFAAYVKARAIGAETIKLTGSDGKLVGGDWETVDADGYLANQGVYIDSSGVGKFTQALLNNCNIKGGTIEVLSVTGELINDVLTTNQKAIPGEEYNIGSIDTSNPYYMGSQAKTKVKSFLASQNKLYAYSGTYAGRSFTQLFECTDGGSIGYFNDNRFSTMEFVKTQTLIDWCGRDIIGFFQTKISYSADYGQTWTQLQDLDSRVAYCYGKYHTLFSAKIGVDYCISSDLQTWTQRTWSITGIYPMYWAVIRTGAASQLLVGITYNTGYMYGFNDNDNGTFQILQTDIRLNPPENKYNSYYDDKNTLWQVCFYGNIRGVGSDGTNCNVLYYSGSTAVWEAINVPSNAIRKTLALYNGYFVILVKGSGGTLSLCAASASSFYDGNAGTLSWSVVYTFSSYLMGDAYLDSQQQGNLVVVYCSRDNVWYNCVSAEDDFTNFIELGITDSNRSEYVPYVFWADYDIIYVCARSTSAKNVKIVRTNRGWRVGLNFLNGDGDLVCYESAMGDYMQNQALTLNNGTTSLLSLPGAIPSDMDVYRKLPKPYDTSMMFLSIDSCKIEEYTRFDTSTNTEVTVSAIDTTKETNPDAVPLRIDISTTSLIVDGVEKANATWFIKDKTSLTAQFTPNSKASGVETGNLDPKENLANASIGTIRPYKVIQATSLRADKLENVYPLGAIFIGLGGVDPNNFLGGTWIDLGTQTLANTQTHVWQRTA